MEITVNSNKIIVLAGLALGAIPLNSMAALTYSWGADAAVGYNDNVYRAPSATYIDYSDALTPTITQIKNLVSLYR